MSALPVAMRLPLQLLSLLALLAGCVSPEPNATGNGGVEVTTDDAMPHVVLVSIDGFGSTYLDTDPTPALERLARNGVRADSLQPVWPTLTFPNHYSIATGLLPSNHGLVA